MPLPVLKVSLCVAGLASCAGLGVLISKIPFTTKDNKKTTTPTVRDLLKEKGYSIMSDGGEGGDAILKAYKSLENNKIVKFSSSTEIQVEDLKRECTLALEDIHTSSYEKAKRGCVEPKKISDRLSELKLTPLKTVGDNEQGDSENGKKLEQWYIKEGAEKIKGLEATSPVTETSGHELRDKCKELFEFNPGNDEYDSSLELSQKGCVVQSVPN